MKWLWVSLGGHHFSYQSSEAQAVKWILWVVVSLLYMDNICSTLLITTDYTFFCVSQRVHWVMRDIHSKHRFLFVLHDTHMQELNIVSMKKSLYVIWEVPDLNVPSLWPCILDGSVWAGGKQTARQADIMLKPLNLIMVLSVPAASIVLQWFYVYVCLYRTSPVQSIILTLLE